MTGKSAVTSNMISLPKGGGSIGGMGETFTPDAFSGTGNFSIPIGVSPGRDGFSPQLSLGYSTGSGNGPFGMGWQLTAPEVVRSTRKGLPRYTDADTFMLSGADLVRDTAEAPATIGEYSVTRFRPRVEGMFARIEHWRKLQPDSAPELSASFWRVTSGDNMTSVFGATAGGVLANPTDKAQIFRWCLELAYDGKGNYIKYTYKPEDNAGIALEQVRQGASSNRYLKRISYGNLTALPSSDASVLAGLLAADHLGSDCLFQVVLDYGEHGRLEDGEELIAADISTATRDWFARSDVFSTCSPGFEVRTARLCKRIFMVHEFPGEQPYLVRSYDFTYAPFKHNGVNSLSRVTQRGYRKSEIQVLKRSEESELGERGVRSYLYEIGSMPPIEFEYSVFEPPLADQLVTLKGDGSSRPVGLHDRDCTLIDLFGRGMNDILETRRDGYRYWQNLGRGRFSEMRRLQAAPLNATLSQEGVGLADITGEGYPDIVEVLGNRWGYYPGRMEGGWGEFQSFPSQPDFSPSDPKVTLMDLTGDGTFDALRTDAEAFVIYESAGAQGFGKGRRIPRVHDLRTFPDIDFTDPRVHVADMNGDGLSDIVMIEGDKVHYWPNLGYGKFGARVTTQVPGLHFEPDQMSFIDIDGNGPADLVQIESGRVSFWINNSGNGWSERYEIRGTPAVISPESVKISDLMGTGTAGILWSSPAGLEAYNYLSLTAAGKPGLLKRVSNNMGLTTRFSYQASTELALAAEREGKPWTGRLPFPVWVLSSIEKIDHITNSRLVTTYEYADGHYDEVNREFVGFGRVDQRDAESFSAVNDGAATRGQLIQPPVLTRMWYHTGAIRGSDMASRQFAGEYYSQDKAASSLQDSALPSGLSPEEQHDALRALKGRLLRQEIYAEDNSDRSGHPYTVSEHSYRVRRIQAATGTTWAVFSAHDAESLDFHYERQSNDPRMSHQLVLEVDEFDHVTLAASVAYPRRPCPDRHAEQSKMLVTATSQSYGQRIDDANGYRHGASVDEQTVEITGIAVPYGGLLAPEGLRKSIQTADSINYEDLPTAGKIQKRIIAWSRRVYWDDAAKTALPAGQVGLLSLPHNTYEAAFTSGLLERVFGDRLDARVLDSEGGYVFEGGIWWRPSGHPQQGAQAFDASHFYRPVRTWDPFGNATAITYDQYALLVEETKDALGNTLSAENDYRVLVPRQLADANGNRQAVAFDALGVVVGSAVMGKDGERLGDSLDGFTCDLDRRTMLSHTAEPLRSPELVLGKATSRFSYDHWHYYRTKRRIQTAESGEPIVTCTLARETHESDLRPGTYTRILHQFLYHDGYGRCIQTKVQAEPAPAPARNNPGEKVDPTTGQLAQAQTTLRWVGTGRTVYDNKGKPVKRYESFFSGSHRFEEESEMVMVGVTPIMFYDPLGRLVATLNPNHSYEKVVFDSWQQAAWDANDTLKLEPHTDPDVKVFFATLPESDYRPTWFNLMRLSADRREQNAASRTESHAGTPAVTRFDSLGRAFLSVTHNRLRQSSGAWQDEKYSTLTKLDIKGKALWIRDARANLAMQYIAPSVPGNQAIDQEMSFVPCYDMAGNLLFQHSMDSGPRWTLNDAAGKALYSWDFNERVTDAGDAVTEYRAYHTTYDELHRPCENRLRINGGDWQRVERLVYGESVPDASVRNLRGQLYSCHDPSGRITHELFDFKRNLLEAKRRLARDYDSPVIDWSEGLSTAGLEDETFAQITEYDGLSRIVRLWDWHRSDEHVSVHEPHYNERGLLDSVVLAVGTTLRQDGTYGGGQKSEVVREIAYDAKGQREHIVFGNGSETSYKYERETYRLKSLVTTRVADGARLQDLHYTYDPLCNITDVSDDAQQTIYFANAVVEPHCSYEYDALYRLTMATGREHADQSGLQGNNRTFEGERQIPFQNSPSAIQNYTEHYAYDAVGNILTTAHSGGGSLRWKRCYQYAQDSNRLLATGKPGDMPSVVDPRQAQYVASPTLSTRYEYDSHGSMLNLSGSPQEFNLRWDHRDLIRHVNLGGGGHAWYNYDVDKQRSRKRIGRIGGVVEERVYLGDMELYRRWSAGGELKEEIETIHQTIGEQCLLLVDDVRTTDNAVLGTGMLYKYQLSNHLGSAVAELDGSARLVSYEEYHPYGTTAFTAVDSTVRATAKRYRYAGMERDDETGLSCHTARYYLPWLGRWCSADPSGVQSGTNMFAYCCCNPVRFADSNGKDPLDKAIEFGIVAVASVPFMGVPLIHWGIAQAGEAAADALHMSDTDRDAAVFAINAIDPVIGGESVVFREAATESREIRSSVQALRGGVRVAEETVLAVRGRPSVAREGVQAVRAGAEGAQEAVQGARAPEQAVHASAQAARVPARAARVGSRGVGEGAQAAARAHAGRARTVDLKMSEIQAPTGTVEGQLEIMRIEWGEAGWMNIHLQSRAGNFPVGSAERASLESEASRYLSLQRGIEQEAAGLRQPFAAQSGSVPPTSPLGRARSGTRGSSTPLGLRITDSAIHDTWTNTRPGLPVTRGGSGSFYR